FPVLRRKSNSPNVFGAFKLYSELRCFAISEYDSRPYVLSRAVNVQGNEVTDFQRSEDSHQGAVQIHGDGLTRIGKSFPLQFHQDVGIDARAASKGRISVAVVGHDWALNL